MMERGMTQAELAARASRILGERISRSLVSMFLIGERTPDTRQARALSKALSGAVSPKDWIDYEVPSDALRLRKRDARASSRKYRGSGISASPLPGPLPQDRALGTCVNPRNARAGATVRISERPRAPQVR